jgi:membrane associated rhomboid family serine protease
MSTSDDRLGPRVLEKTQTQRQGLVLLAGIVAFMWLVEAINTVDSNHLDSDGIYARNISRFWGILTSPFIHASFQHLTDNTIPFLFLGAIIALHGAGRLAVVTAFIIVIGGLGTWLISPGGNADTIGASGVVFGYATYLLTRGFFDRSVWEIVVGAVVGAVWGAVLVSSLVPHAGISWQAHLSGAIAGVIIAWRLSVSDAKRQPVSDAVVGTTARPRSGDGR